MGVIVVERAGRDLAEGKVSPLGPEPVNWYDMPQSQPFLADWKQRREFKRCLATAPSPSQPENNSKKAKQ